MLEKQRENHLPPPRPHGKGSSGMCTRERRKRKRRQREWEPSCQSELRRLRRGTNPRTANHLLAHLRPRLRALNPAAPVRVAACAGGDTTRHLITSSSTNVKYICPGELSKSLAWKVDVLYIKYMNYSLEFEWAIWHFN